MSDERLDNQTPALFGQTPSQTVGPFFHYGLPWKGGADLVGDSDLGACPELFPPAHYVLNRPHRSKPPRGQPIIIQGYVLDGVGAPVPDALVEIWQADADGCYPFLLNGSEVASDPDFIGFGRCATAEDGRYGFKTVMPGPVSMPDGGLQARHIALSVMARGLLNRLVTRLYFAGAEENDSDPVLRLVPKDRRHTLLACLQGEGEWRFDIRLQGQGETVFFEL